MWRIRLVMRFLFLLFLTAVPCAGIGFAIARVPGAIAGSALAVFILLALSLFAEKLLTWLYGCERDVVEGVAHTIQKMSRAGDNVNLTIRVFSHPLPQALIVRSLGSRGTLIVSQGLLAHMSEREIRSYLKHAQDLADEPGRRFFSLSAVLACGMVMLAPREAPWSLFIPVPAGASESGTISLWTGIRFLCVLPFLRRFLALARPFQTSPVPYVLYPGAAPLHFFLREG